jgi:DNA polymerase-3 subunit alpha
VFAEIDLQMNRAGALQRDRERGQAALFDIAPVNARRQATGKPAEVEWSQSEMLAFEKELLGFYVSGHPLSRYAGILQRYELASTSKLEQAQEGQGARLGGIIGKLQLRTTKQGKPMALLTLEDLDGTVEVVAFSEVYSRCAANLRADAAVFVSGKVDRRMDKLQVIADQILPLGEVPRRFTKAMHIHLSAGTTDEAALTRVHDVLRAHQGPCPVFFCFIYPDGKAVFLETHEKFSVTPSEELVRQLEAVLGGDTVRLKVDTEKMAASARPPRNGDWPRRRNGEGD